METIFLFPQHWISSTRPHSDIILLHLHHLTALTSQDVSKWKQNFTCKIVRALEYAPESRVLVRNNLSCHSEVPQAYDFSEGPSQLRIAQFFLKRQVRGPDNVVRETQAPRKRHWCRSPSRD
jgi:hypothetical protein